MRVPLSCVAVLVTLLGQAFAAEPDSAQLLRDPVGLVKKEGALSPGDEASLDRGGVVAKVVDTPDRSEVYSIAIARVNATAAQAAQYLRNVELRRKEPWILQLGRLGTPPSPAEMEPLTLEPGEVKHLGRCRTSQCDVRLSSDAIERFRREVDWSTPAQAGRANAVFRDVLLALANGYLGRGNGALFEYANNDDPARVGDSLEMLRQRSPFLQDAAPDVYAYLRSFPEGKPADADDAVYWARERFWLLNVLSLNHQTVVQRSVAGGSLVLAVTKQLYATHYYESSLGVTAFVETKAGAYLVFINRTRADIRRTGFTWLERLLLKRLVRGRVEGQMKHLRAQLQGA